MFNQFFDVPLAFHWHSPLHFPTRKVGNKNTIRVVFACSGMFLLLSNPLDECVFVLWMGRPGKLLPRGFDTMIDRVCYYSIHVERKRSFEKRKRGTFMLTVHVEKLRAKGT